MDSPQDIAWADSCLSEDPDILDGGWDSLKDALLEGLNSQHDPSPYEREYSPEVVNMDIVPDENTGNDIDSVEEKNVKDIAATGEGSDSGLNAPKYASLEALNIQFQSSHYGIDNTPLLKQLELEEIHSSEGIDVIHNSSRTPVSIADTSDRAEPSGDASFNKDADGFWSKHKMQDVFLPTYDESLKDLGLSDPEPEVDFVFQEFKLELSTDDIFKTWDFDIPSEENDLIKQLNKALAGNPLQPTPPFSDDSEAWKGLQDRSVDDLISGLTDLTLSPKRVLT